MPNNLIENETEYVLSAAIARCGDLQDAQDLAQETILSALLFIQKGGVIERPRPFLSTLLNRKYYDMLRRRYRIPTVSMDNSFDIADDEDESNASFAENAEAVRREVACLAHSYRSVIVKHYFYGKSVRDIANELDMPVGTVKSRLDYGRKQMKRGLEKMEKYKENSYAPQELWVRNSGRPGMDGEPLSLTEGDALAQNLLILAYEKPITVSDLSKAIGVAAAYVEPVVRRMVDGGLMQRMGDGRVYTDFIIYHAEDYVKYIHEQETFVKEHLSAYTEPLKAAIAELKETPFYSRRLERFMMINIASGALYSCMTPMRNKPQVFPDRPNGGKWIAFGTICPENYQIPAEKRGKEDYMMAGIRGTTIDNYLGAGKLKIYNYETSLDPNYCCKFDGYGISGFSDVEVSMLKLFYLLKKGIPPESVDLDARIIKGIPLLEERGFIRSRGGHHEVLIPVLTHDEEKRFRSICKKAIADFGNNIREPMAEWCRTHKKDIPPHLTSVPDQKLTMPFEPSGMMFVFEAIAAGIHPRDLGGPCPETIAVFG